MPKHPILEFIRVDRGASTPISVQLSQQLSWLIASGEIMAGDKLPPAKLMADHLGIHLHTARSAYQKLKDDGLVEIHRGSGTTVLPYTRARLAKQSPDVSSFIIGVFIPGYSPFYLPLLEGIEDGAVTTPSQIIVCNTHENPADRYLDRLLTKGLDGFILVSKGLSPEFEAVEFPERRIALPPMVSVDRPHAKGHSIVLDLESAGFQATHHLLDHGHKRVGLISCPLEWSSVKQTYQGYRRALTEAGLEHDPDLVAIAPEFRVEAGRQALLRLLQSSDPPSAVFAIDDMLAIGALKALKEMKLKVPEDIAVVGNTNIQFSSVVDPPLTTVSAPAYEMGATAIDMLNRLIRGEKVRPRRRVFEMRLIVRQSCGCQPDL